MKIKAYRRSFCVSLIAFGSIAALSVGIFAAYIGTRKIGFDSNTTIIELCSLNTVRFMDWYFETDFLEKAIMFILKHLPEI